MKKVLFVCLGNICRSPTAEGIFTAMVESKGKQNDYVIDSAGTSGHHEGEPADARSREHAQLRGYNLESTSRGLVKNDYDYFDYIIAMDKSNFENITRIKPETSKSKIVLITDLCKVHTVDQVPDPYYKGEIGFELVLDILEDSCKELLNKLEANEI